MFDCVIPAAGASSRMRRPAGPAISAGQAISTGQAFKPLLPFAGSSLVETAVASALGASCRVILVTGNRGAELASLFAGEGHLAARDEGRLLLVDNPRWEEGFLGSIQCALPLVEGDSFFLSLADMPFISSGDYRSLADALLRLRAAKAPPTAVHGAHEGRRGHPALLPSAWIPEILAQGRGGTMKDFLKGRPLLLVETGSGALRDIDTPEEYAAALEVP